MPQNFILRKAIKSDCEQLLHLVRELAFFEKAPNEVTVTLEEMIEAGFGLTPLS